MVLAFGVIHLGSYSLIIEQSIINSKLSLNESGMRRRVMRINLVWKDLNKTMLKDLKWNGFSELKEILYKGLYKSNKWFC